MTWPDQIRDGNFSAVLVPGDPDLFIARWCLALGSNDQASLRRRLSRSGLSLDDLIARLGPPNGRQAEENAAPFEFFDAGENPAALGATAAAQPFAALIAPIVTAAAAQLRARLLSSSSGGTDIMPDGLTDGLRARVATLLVPCLYAQFCDARGAGPSLLASLGLASGGVPARERYEQFVSRLRREKLAPVLTQYPVLRRLLRIAILNWIESCVRVLERAGRHHRQLAAAFGFSPAMHLAEIQMDLGDPHRHGQSVCLLIYRTPGRGDVRVVYKPRPVGIDSAFADFVAAVNGVSRMPPLRAAAVLVADGYGFCEHIAWQACAGEHELRQFYGNAGRLLAILYLLGGEDAHCENVIAAGRDLVLIDCEILLVGEDALQPQSVALSIAHSVLRTSLLPWWRVPANEGSGQAVDPSGLGQEPQTGTVTMPQWRDVNLDTMHWGPGAGSAAFPASYPAAGYKPGLLMRFGDAVKEGFRQQLELLLAHREALLAPDGSLARFAGLTGRIVLRPTHLYAAIQERALDPDALRSIADRGLKLEPLARAHLQDDGAASWPLFESELEQLEALDIPVFEQQTDSRDVMLPGGGRIAGKLRRSGLECCQDRLATLTSAGIDLQLRLIQGAFDAKASRHRGEAANPSAIDPIQPACVTAPQEPRRQTILVEKMVKAAIQAARQAPEWLGLDVAQDGQHFQFGLVGLSLYGGQAGISLFLKHAMQDASIRSSLPADIAEAILDCGERLDTRLNDFMQTGRDATTLLRLEHLPLGLAGLGGLLLYDWLRTTRFAGAVQSRSPAGPIMDAARSKLGRSPQASIIAGSAGLIGPLLRHAAIAGKCAREDIMALARDCGDALCQAQASDGGWVEIGTAHRLTGFSHGAAGIVAALAQLHAQTGLERYRIAALSGLEFERRHYDPVRRNWPDYRTAVEPRAFLVSWCHGAAGVALGRLCLHGTPLWDGAVEQEMSTAVETCIEHQYRSATLCCGSAGAAFIADRASHLAAPAHAARWKGHADRLMQQSAGAPIDELQFPGLFSGAAGIGFACMGDAAAGTIIECLSAGLLAR